MSGLSTHRARLLRKSQTNAESRLWWALRDRQLFGHKFVRQLPIEGYIVDFCCRQARLIVETDGGQHDLRRERDAERTAHLESRGYTVHRFWNTEVLNNIDGVLERMAIELESRIRTDEQP